MPCLHSLRSWAMHIAFARLRHAGKMIISPRLCLRQIILIGALIKCLSLNHPLLTTIIKFQVQHMFLLSLWSKVTFAKSVQSLQLFRRWMLQSTFRRSRSNRWWWVYFSGWRRRRWYRPILRPKFGIFSMKSKFFSFSNFKVTRFSREKIENYISLHHFLRKSKCLRFSTSCFLRRKARKFVFVWKIMQIHVVFIFLPWSLETISKSFEDSEPSLLNNFRIPMISAI